MEKTSLTANTQNTYCDIPDRIHQVRAVVIFLANAVGKMLEDADHIPDHEDNDLGADLTFKWLINEMQGILESLEAYKLVKKEVTQ